MDIDTLREMCLALPGTTEELQWGEHLLYKVAGKMFCIGSINQDDGVGFKVPEEDFDELTARPGIIPAPHLARAKWVKVMDGKALKPAEWKALIHQSYALVKAKLPKKVQATLME